MTRRKHEVELELERTQRELREARERLSEAEASIADMCRGREHLTRQLAALHGGRDGARAALFDLVAGLSLDDGPRAAAIQRARALLEGWGMR